METELQVPVSKMQLKGWKSADISDSVSFHYQLWSQPVMNINLFFKIKNRAVKSAFNAESLNAET